MNATGKRARAQTDLNRYGVHRLQHTPKSYAVRRRKHWIRARRTSPRSASF